MKRKTVIKDRSFIYRYPRFSVAVLTTLGVGIFFSRPLYDIFFTKPNKFEADELIRTHKSRFSRT